MLPRRGFGCAPGVLVVAAAATLSLPAAAVDPVLRHQADMRGDVVVFGSTLAFDCGSPVPAPPGSTAACAAELNTADTAPDLYWRDDTADASITPTQARTSATLVLPPGASVTYARLYWAALKDGPDADLDATLDWLGGPEQTITADDSWVVPYGFASHPTWNYYQATGDATDFVATWGAGDFRVSDVEGLAFGGQDVDRAFSAWTLVVFYERDSDELRNLALFDGFTPIDPGMVGQQSASVLLDGFLVPQGHSAQMTALTYEGDLAYTGDHFTMNGVQVSNAKNAADNFFNSSRSKLGVSVSGPVDVPKLTGEPGSMAGYDLDTIDVTAQVSAGDTSATVAADSDLDIFFLGGFATSVTSLSPHFKVTKEAEHLDGGAVLAGDVIEYTLTAINAGNDVTAIAGITDALDPGLAFVPGSIEIVQGGADGTKTDGAGDDEGEYASGSKTITVRVGAGATAQLGGAVAPGETVIVKFRATLTGVASTVLNQATLEASGEAGAPEKTYLSDGDPLTIGDQPTVVVVDECGDDSDCSGDTPHCDPATHQCVGCQTDADCPDPALPACQPSGACGECSATNDSLCSAEKPVCDTGPGICVCKVDSDCAAPGAGVVCDAATQTCVDGCHQDADCPEGQHCSTTDGSLGECVGDTGGSSSGGPGRFNDPGDTGGCGCSVPGRGGWGEGGGALALLATGLAAAVRRRRRR